MSFIPSQLSFILGHCIKRYIIVLTAFILNIVQLLKAERILCCLQMGNDFN